MTRWRIWIEVAHGAHEYLGEAAGETFEEACRSFAVAYPEIHEHFDERKMTVRGCRLVPLDRHRDGISHIFTPRTAARANGG